MDTFHTNIQNDLTVLVSSLKPYIGGSILKWSTHQSKLGKNARCINILYNSEYGQSVLSVDITQKGEIYNPICMPNALPILFDWVNRIDYDKTRHLQRISLIINELQQKIADRRYIFDNTLHPSQCQT
jgi:hypothetical protein